MFRCVVVVVFELCAVLVTGVVYFMCGFVVIVFLVFIVAWFAYVFVLLRVWMSRCVCVWLGRFMRLLLQWV